MKNSISLNLANLFSRCSKNFSSEISTQGPKPLHCIFPVLRSHSSHSQTRVFPVVVALSSHTLTAPLRKVLVLAVNLADGNSVLWYSSKKLATNTFTPIPLLFLAACHPLLFPPSFKTRLTRQRTQSRPNANLPFRHVRQNPFRASRTVRDMSVRKERKTERMCWSPSTLVALDPLGIPRPFRIHILGSGRGRRRL